MAVLVVDIGSGMFLAGILLRLSASLSFQASWLVWTIGTVMLLPCSSSATAVVRAMLVLLVMLLFALCSHRSSPGLGCSTPEMLRTIAKINQKTTLIIRSSSTLAVACAKLVFLPLCSLWLQTGPDACHFGRYGPEEHVRSWLVLQVTMHLASLFLSSRPRCSASWPVRIRRTVARCVLFKVVDITVMTQRLIPTVQAVLQTVEIPQLLLCKVVDVFFLQVVQVSLSFTRPWCVTIGRRHSCRDEEAA